MAHVFNVICGQCDEVEIYSEDVKIIQIKDGYHPQDKSYDTFVATCPCPGCASLDKPNQLFFQVDKDIRKRLFQYGVEVLEYDPKIKGQVPRKKSLLAQFVDTPRRAHAKILRGCYELRKCANGEKKENKKLEREVEGLEHEVVLSETDIDRFQRDKCTNRPKKKSETKFARKYSNFSKRVTLSREAIGLDFRINPN